MEKTTRRRASIPHDIIYDIFSWLPVKSLMRFKCVTKSCNTFISDPDFVDIHRNRFVETKILLWTGVSIYNLQEKGDGKATFLQTDMPAEIYDPDYVQSSSYANGLVCFWSTEEYRCAIFNPYRRELKYLPELNEHLHRCSCTLGFEPQENKYKVLLTALVFSGNRVYWKSWIFTIGIDKSWREIPTTFHNDCIGAGVCINGIIYNCLLRDEGMLRMTSLHAREVSAFDLKSESFKVLALWDDASVHDSGYYYPVAVKGKLAFIDSYEWSSKGFVDLWILEKKNPTEDQWQRHTIQVPSTCEGFAFNLTVSSSDGEIFLFLIQRSGIICLCYDVMKKSSREIVMEGLPKEIEGICCGPETLFPL